MCSGIRPRRRRSLQLDTEKCSIPPATPQCPIEEELQKLGYSNFKPGQLKGVQAILTGEDALLCIQTGSNC